MTESNGKPNYHVEVFLSRDLFECLANRFEAESLEGMIKEAWVRTINVPVYEAPGAAWIPENAVNHISSNDPDSFADAFYRLSYLAKTSTKPYGDGSQWFGYSRN